jgi:catechol 2,3-dioxygenase-like lactoylglutathione lyase family enzyme
MDLRLEVVALPVADVDRAIGFYAGKLGFAIDHDSWPRDGVRLVQLTPPGSACSIHIGTGLAIQGVTPGSAKGMHLVVRRLDEVVAALAGAGVEVSEIEEFRGRVKQAYFSDPDGNEWTLQQKE